MLHDVNEYHPNIKLVRRIGTNVSFLDVHIENKNGILTTSVYHKEAAEPYLVPFKSDHPRHIFLNITDTALLRAVRYSSTLAIFNEERRSIKLMLLYNGYAPRYIYGQLMKFLQANLSIQSLLPVIQTENDFLFMRSYLLNRSTTTERQMATRIATATDSDIPDPTDNRRVPAQPDRTSKWIDNVIIHYTHEQRLTSCKKDIHQLWNQTFSETHVMNTKLIVGNRNSRNATRTLVHQGPDHNYLRKNINDANGP